MTLHTYHLLPVNVERTLHTVLTVDTLVTVDTVLTIRYVFNVVSVDTFGIVRYVFNYPYFLQSVATAIRCNSASSERYRLRWALPRLASASVAALLRMLPNVSSIWIVRNRNSPGRTAWIAGGVLVSPQPHAMPQQPNLCANTLAGYENVGLFSQSPKRGGPREKGGSNWKIEGPFWAILATSLDNPRVPLYATAMKCNCN